MWREVSKCKTRTRTSHNLQDYDVQETPNKNSIDREKTIEVYIKGNFLLLLHYIPYFSSVVKSDLLVYRKNLTLPIIVQYKECPKGVEKRVE